MSVSTVVTFGYGSFSTVALVVTDGFGFGGAVITPPAQTGGGGVKRHHFASYLTAEEKKRLDLITAMLEAELNKLPIEPPTTKAQKKQVAKVEQKIERYRAQIVKLDPIFGSAIDGVIAIAKANLRRDTDLIKIIQAKREQKQRNTKALLMLLKL